MWQCEIQRLSGSSSGCIANFGREASEMSTFPGYALTDVQAVIITYTDYRMNGFSA